MIPRKPLILTALCISMISSAFAKMPVMAAYWAADRKASDTVKNNYPTGVLPGVINRLILTHTPFQDFEELEKTPLWKENLAEYKTLKGRGVAIWLMITNGQKAYLEKGADDKYIQDLVGFCVRNGIDGVDIDFEGESTVGHPNYNNFCRKLADALHAQKKQVSMAVHTHWTFGRVEDATLGKMDNLMLMAYDEHGNWNVNKDGPHSSFDYAKSCVQKAEARKVPANKILLGMPTYGYRWWTENGKRQAAEFGWPALLKKYPANKTKDVAGPGANTADGIWHYNGIPTVKKKIAWANSKKLAGIGVWHGNYEVKGADSFWLNVKEANR